eukprot:Lithocolla_globosa_v1_NODE_419_length_4112_cov_8.573330.p1 type:complete len:604 gc:universal NODE_419_length_4112_cov_8.573330:280-2091(+)
MSGLGKTRLLEEGPNIFKQADITGLQYFALVTYGNGHGLRSVENSMSVFSSFSWRLLHSFFLNNNSKPVVSFEEFFKYGLPSNAGDLTLTLALKTILKAVKKDDKPVYLFVGIDEYQIIDRIERKAVAKKGLVLDLVTEFLDIICDPIPGLVVLPMLAGTDFRMLSIPGSSTVETDRLPMSLLNMYESITAVESMPKGSDYTCHAPFTRHLFFLGGVPRWVAEYTEKVANSDGPLCPAIFEKAFAVQMEQRVNQLGFDINWGNDEFIELAAYSLAGKQVNEAARDIGRMSWARIRDSSLCLLENDYVIVPYAVLRRIGGFLTPDTMSLAKRCFVWTIESLIEQVDSELYLAQPWQLWERFGAHFHAARINALQILGETVVPFSHVCNGALSNGCDKKVVLRPVEVFTTSAKFSENIDRNIPHTGDSQYKIDWVGGDTMNEQNHGYVVINGEGGNGVDIFFSLKCSLDERYLVCTDQRKRKSGYMGENAATELIKKARIYPKNLKVPVVVVVGLFSMFPHFNHSKSVLPPNSFVVSYDQTSSYHGGLQYHPASSPCINVNDDSVSALKMCLFGTDASKGATLIIDRRKTVNLVATIFFFEENLF